MIVLKNQTEEGIPLQATYLPDKGMNMISFKIGETELIDQTTLSLFEERFAGLGALIGPHFHSRKIVPKIADESLFPHIERTKKQGRKDPFSHGIARYAPWKAKSDDTHVVATIFGDDEWKGIPLKELEGQNFKMSFEAHLLPDGLHLDLSVTSDTDSLVGIHYYWRLPNGKGTIRCNVQKPIPKEWDFDDQNHLIYPLTDETDFTFHPYPNPLAGQIILETEEYKLLTAYSCTSQENAFQIYHPKGASFVCIEPVSAQNPRAANLSVSSLSIHLKPFCP